MDEIPAMERYDAGDIIVYCAVFLSSYLLFMMDWYEVLPTVSSTSPIPAVADQHSTLRPLESLGPCLSLDADFQGLSTRFIPDPVKHVLHVLYRV